MKAKAQSNVTAVVLVRRTNAECVSRALDRMPSQALDHKAFVCFAAAGNDPALFVRLRSHDPEMLLSLEKFGPIITAPRMGAQTKADLGDERWRQKMIRFLLRAFFAARWLRVVVSQVSERRLRHRKEDEAEKLAASCSMRATGEGCMYKVLSLLLFTGVLHTSLHVVLAHPLEQPLALRL